MSLPQFRLLRPRDLGHAVESLARYSGNIRVLAGGTDLIPSMRQKLFEPKYVLDLRGIAELRGIRTQADEMCIRDSWMDFFTYTDFVDRDGKFQLQMLKYSAFAPLGRSMSYMLREEAFHMGTGNDGLRRIVEAGVIPGWLIQRYLNKWISSSYDLFGTDHSSSAHWAYVLSLIHI